MRKRKKRGNQKTKTVSCQSVLTSYLSLLRAISQKRSRFVFPERFMHLNYKGLANFFFFLFFSVRFPLNKFSFLFFLFLNFFLSRILWTTLPDDHEGNFVFHFFLSLLMYSNPFLPFFYFFFV